VPDLHTAARCLIKDYVDGKLRFCHLPPGQGAMCPGVNTSLISAASHAALAATGAALAANGSAAPGIEASDAAVGANDKDVRLALQGTREKIVFQMDSGASAELGVAVGQTNAGRKGRTNRALSAGVWAEEDEATLLKVRASLCICVSLYLIMCVCAGHCVSSCVSLSLCVLMCLVWSVLCLSLCK